jgi:uncharacterized membrane protein YfcA
MESGWLQLATAVLAGCGVGFLSGLFGVGGGFLIVPVLKSVLGIPIEFAVGVGACQVLGPATTSLLARRVNLSQLRLPLILLGGLSVGVFSGVSVLEFAKHQGEVSLWGRPLLMADLVVLAVYFAILLSVAIFSLWDTRRNPINRIFTKGWIAGWKIPPYVRLIDFDYSRISIIVLSWFGLAIGFLSGLLGMSGGLVLLPGFIYLLGMKTHQAVRNTLVIVWLVAVQSTVIHALNDNISLPLVMSLLFGGTIGARLGSELSQKMVGGQLRKGFGWLLIGAACLVGYELFAIFAG